MLITCPYDRSDQDGDLCKVKRRSARLQHRRHKPVTLTNCLRCKAGDEIIVDGTLENIMQCESCNKPTPRNAHHQRYCPDCRIRIARERNHSDKAINKLRRQVKANAKKLCKVCGKHIPVIRRQAQICLSCKRIMKGRA